MKRVSIVVALILIGVVVWLYLGSHKSKSTVRQSDQQSATGAVAALSKEMPQAKERLTTLENAGQVPENDHNVKDWQIAENTTWWGKPLDPKNFWKGRILWNDKTATLDAQRHGRLYPPMPYEDTNLPPYPNDEGISRSFSPDGPNISYAESSKEGGFWDKFDRTHPRPPDQIEHEQESIAGNFLDTRHSGDKNPLVKHNYPPEAFTTNALFWAYVQLKRTQYQDFLSRGNRVDDPWFQILMSDFSGDSKLITDPLTSEEMRTANAWKVAYLQRLRLEHTDDQYIQGYMQAWNLSSNQVFGPGN